MSVLTILIPTIPDRQHMLVSLCNELYRQIDGWGVKILPDDRINITIGEKRNYLLQSCTSEYFCFFDDDDWPEPTYVQDILKAISNKPDCASLRGIMTTNGDRPEIFEHSLRYKYWRESSTGNIRYERTNNHLNAIRTEIGQKFSFPNMSHGEDHRWSSALAESGLLKNEYYIDKILYNYRYVSNK